MPALMQGFLSAAQADICLTKYGKLDETPISAMSRSEVSCCQYDRCIAWKESASQADLVSLIMALLSAAALLALLLQEKKECHTLSRRTLHAT